MGNPHKLDTLDHIGRELRCDPNLETWEHDTTGDTYLPAAGPWQRPIMFGLLKNC